jgi:rod shape-determining protein MreD
MNWFNTIAILVIAYLAVFAQATMNEFRLGFGAQIDLLPSLVVYASLSGGVLTLTLLAICGGLWLDSLSANPLGTSMLPLFLAGLLIQRSRDLILRQQPFAQFVLGASASAAVPVMTLLLLLNTSEQPLVSWFSLWQWIVMTVAGGAITPLWFLVFDRIGEALNYRPLGETSFRADREIKRGRQT